MRLLRGIRLDDTTTCSVRMVSKSLEPWFVPRWLYVRVIVRRARGSSSGRAVTAASRVVPLSTGSRFKSCPLATPKPFSTPSNWMSLCPRCHANAHITLRLEKTGRPGTRPRAEIASDIMPRLPWDVIRQQYDACFPRA